MSEPAKIKARFLVTRGEVTIQSNYKGISSAIAWKRSDDSDDVRAVRTLINSLPAVLEDGLREIYVVDQTKRLDYELEELLRDEDDRREPLDGRGDQ